MVRISQGWLNLPFVCMAWPGEVQQLHVSSCSATSHGGCFYVKEGAEFTTPLLLRGCKAKGAGGAIYLQQGSLVGKQIICSQCHSPTSGCLHLEDGQASIGSLLLDSGSRLVPESTNIVAAGDDANVTLGRADCRKVPGCTFAVAQMQLARLLCQRGESRQFLPDGDGTACKECPTGNIRLVAVDEARSGGAVRLRSMGSTLTYHKGPYESNIRVHTENLIAEGRLRP